MMSTKLFVVLAGLAVAQFSPNLDFIGFAAIQLPADDDSDEKFDALPRVWPQFGATRQFGDGDDDGPTHFGNQENYGRNTMANRKILQHAGYLSLINDKDNFQIAGCNWNVFIAKCSDALGLCKGGCRDFSMSLNAIIHDCRCVPYGFSALLKLAG
ncbi:unnamed protein product [Caenorhabditis bovis]|uniref:Uncharacterized protein n=1 Tax=Caenorhabditis bovis TaxID=2654633 RepID=A0A8S1EH29_9PELO|nr:unnamed protein product [Caenorhabditis bovis]